MSTFQAIVYAIVRGFSEFLPISPVAHTTLVSEALGWAPPPEQLHGYLSLGTLLAVLIYFRHDWASMISSFLTVLLYRKKPMTPDERMPFFLILATVPIAVGWHYLHQALPTMLNDPIWLAASVAAFAFALVIGEVLGRKNKGMFDWNWLDALAIGFAQVLALVPGCGRMTGALAGGLLRGYNREAIAKFAFFASAPVLGGSVLLHLRGIGDHSPEVSDLSWVTLTVATVVSCIFGMLAIGGFMKQVQRKGLNQYVIYRWVLAAVLLGAVWARSQGLLG